VPASYAFLHDKNKTNSRQPPVYSLLQAKRRSQVLINKLCLPLECPTLGKERANAIQQALVGV